MVKKLMKSCSKEYGNVKAKKLFSLLTIVIKCDCSAIRTSLPKQVLQYPDFNYPHGAETYVEQITIYKYLRSYAERFDLIDKLKLSTTVTKVKPIGDGKWRITSEPTENSEHSEHSRHSVHSEHSGHSEQEHSEQKHSEQEHSEHSRRSVHSGHSEHSGHSHDITEEEFDWVFVCSGFFSKPYIPTVRGIEQFQGTKIHSTQFRTASDYAGNRDIHTKHISTMKKLKPTHIEI